MMMTKIIWRNIWRNKRRSLVVLSSVIIGVIAIILNDSFNNGFIDQMLSTQINLHTSHLQIHKKGFQDNQNIQNFIEYRELVKKTLEANQDIQHYSLRIISFGLVSSANSSSGVTIIGVDPDKEKNITIIRKSIIDGKYLEKGKRDIVIGKKMAEKLEVGIGDKIVAVSSSTDGSIGSELFRVSGIYRAGGSEAENLYIYIPIDFADKLLGMDGKINEAAVITKNIEDIDKIQINLSKSLGTNYEILTYKELLPLIISLIETSESSVYFFWIIIGLAVIFGIINTMLMSVFERINEFGVLLSIGMKKGKLFRMVIGESLFLGIIGSIAGTALGLLIYLPFAKTGIDFSTFSEAMSKMGLNSIIYPSINPKMLIISLLVMPVTTVIGAIYPAFKAVRLQPSEAMRHV